MVYSVKIVRGDPVTYYMPNHWPDKCQGSYCTVHNPSPHSMVEWQLHWRGDRYPPIYERICPEHGVGHPDPDCIQYLIRELGQAGYTASIHGCCGCPECVTAFKPIDKKRERRKV